MTPDGSDGTDGTRGALTGVGGLRALLREDLRAHHGWLVAPGFQAVALHRIGRWALAQPAPLRQLVSLLYRVGYLLVRNVYGIEIPRSVQLGRRVHIAHQHGIVVHPRAAIGDECVLRQGVTLGAGAGDQARFDKQAPKVGRGVNFGAGAAVVGGVRIGDGATIGPNVTVFTNVPAGATLLPPAPRLMRAPDQVAERERRESGRAG